MLSRKNMEKLMYDVYIAEALIDNDYQNFDTPEKKEALINEVFRKHKITQAEWDTSLSWYSDKIEIYLKMNDSVKARLQRYHKATEQIMNRQLQQERDLAAWSYSPSYIPNNYAFDEIIPKNGFRFRLDTAEITNKIKSAEFDFGFNVIGVPANSNPNLRTMLMLEYKDTIIYRTELINENRNYTLHGQKYLTNLKDTLVLNDTLQKITGFVKLQDRSGKYRNIRLSNIFLGNPNDSLLQDQNSLSMPQERIPMESMR
ncbi:MAG: DUF4296 domain-containing protein [Bacteroidia bacterium]|nr:DUF4296 domain-containing protein [Bacteroidia bacterium]